MDSTPLFPDHQTIRWINLFEGGFSELLMTSYAVANLFSCYGPLNLPQLLSLPQTFMTLKHIKFNSLSKQLTLASCPRSHRHPGLPSKRDIYILVNCKLALLCVLGQKFLKLIERVNWFSRQTKGKVSKGHGHTLCRVLEVQEDREQEWLPWNKSRRNRKSSWAEEPSPQPELKGQLLAVDKIKKKRWWGRKKIN